MSDTRTRSVTWPIQCIVAGLIAWLAMTEVVILARKHISSATSLQKPSRAAHALDKKLRHIVQHLPIPPQKAQRMEPPVVIVMTTKAPAPVAPAPPTTTVIPAAAAAEAAPGARPVRRHLRCRAARPLS